MRFTSRHQVALSLVCLTAVSLFSVGCGQPQPSQPAAQAAPPPAQAAAPPAQSPVERGRYLATIMDCNGCHTPFKNGEPDMTRPLMGHPETIKITEAPKLPAGWGVSINETNTAWAGPWGVSFTANLTSDKSTGIGFWTEEMFITSIRQGKHMGSPRGRELLAPMPWRMQAQMTDEDLKAMFAYLLTVPPIANKVPEPIPPAGAPAGGSGQ